MAAATPNAREIFMAALDVPPAERAAYLEAICGGDAALRQRVDALLHAHDQPGPFLSEAGAPAGDTSDYQPTLEAVTVIAGRYTLQEKIGEGGMGEVWVARQTEPVRRRVALKLIKAGMDSRAVLARFEAERQALALMDHPNIAKVLDGGATPDGRPFFVMELVKGVPITEYCDARKLTPRERLELFIPVCQAIQHAHQKGIIHRDIKPGNVLVALFDDKPVPKVIDFGVAKATGQQLTEKTLDTDFGAVVGTPEYMSPEQASFNNLDIDTRSDVYALGVLLYELLAGSPPFSRKELGKNGLLEILRVVREVEPPRPSTKLSTADALPTLSANRGTEPARLARALRGELDWIVMKALEKDRARRYDSANGFSADVQRFLAGEPVQAVPPSAGYRLRKFAKRNRSAVSAAGALAAVLLAATGVSLAFGLMAKRAEETAEQRRRDAEANEAKAIANEARAVHAGEQSRAARDELWASLYVARCPMIQSAWDASDYGRLRGLLAAQVPAPGQRDHRGFEWHYLDRLISADLRTVAISPKDASDYPTDRSDTFKGSPPPLRQLRLSPDGTRLLRFTGSGQNRQMLSYDTTTGRLRFAVRAPADIVYGVWYSPDGKWISESVVETIEKPEGVVRQWDAATGAEDRGAERAAPDFNTRFLQPRSPDGTLRVVGTGKYGKDGVELIDTRTGQPLSKPGDPPLPQGASRGAPVAFSPDNKRLVIAGKTLTVWEAAPRRKLWEAAGEMLNPVFSPDGTRIAYVRGPDAVIAEAATGRVRRTIKGHDGGIEYVAFTRDGSVLVTAGPECVKHWDATLDERPPTIKAWPGAPSPDGRRVGRFDDPLIKVWGPGDGAPVTFKVSPLPELKRPEEEYASDLFVPNSYPFSFSPDGRLAAMGIPFMRDMGRHDHERGWDCYFRLWDLEAGRELLLVSRFGAVTERAFSPDGRLLVALFDPPGEAVVWDAPTGQHRYTLKLPRGHNFVFAFSTDGNWIVAVGGEGDDLAVALWDAGTGRRLPATDVPFGREQSRFRLEWLAPALGPGGKRVAAFVRKNAVNVWDTETGGNLIELKGVKGLAPNTTRLAFSPDGSRLATCTKSGGLTLWNPDTGTELLSLQVPAKGVHHLAFTPDGHSIRLVVQTDDGLETRLLDGSPRPGLRGH